MATSGRPSTSYNSRSTPYPSFTRGSTMTRDTSLQGPSTGRKTRTRSGTKTAASTTATSREHQPTCALSESRGISPIVGLAFIDFTHSDAVLCQISDNQTFVRTIHQLYLKQPVEILLMSTAAQPKSQLYSAIEAHLPILPHTRLIILDRKYWSETEGNEYIEQLALRQDLEAIKVSVGGNFYATCCIAAVCSVDFCELFSLKLRLPRC